MGLSHPFFLFTQNRLPEPRSQDEFLASYLVRSQSFPWLKASSRMPKTALDRKTLAWVILNKALDDTFEMLFSTTGPIASRASHKTLRGPLSQRHATVRALRPPRRETFRRTFHRCYANASRSREGGWHLPSFSRRRSSPA